MEYCNLCGEPHKTENHPSTGDVIGMGIIAIIVFLTTIVSIITN